MNFDMQPEQVQFADAVRGFAKAKLEAGALDRAHASGFPFDVAKLLSHQGLMGITFDEAHGGQGGSLVDAIIAIEEVGLVCPRSADVIQAGNFGPIRTFYEYATPEQRERYLPGLLDGSAVISLAMTESEAGSAATDLATTATQTEGGYLLNGSKIFSTHSPDAALFLVYVRFGPGVNGIGSVLVERGTEGLTVGKPSQLMGGEAWSELSFHDCYIPSGNVLLGPGGFRKQIASFNVERLGNAARSIALGRYAFNLARDYALTRRQFDRELCEFQGIQWKFADAAVKLEGARLLLYRAAISRGENELPTAHDTAVAKLACNIAGFEVANEAVQVMGGLGYSREALAEYCLRRTRGWMIAGGSIEILKNRVAESIFERHFSQRGQRAQAAE